MNSKKIIILACLTLAVLLFYTQGVNDYLKLETLKALQSGWSEAYQARPLKIIAIYFVIYVAVTGLSMPGAALMTLLGGALFGVIQGTVIVSFASTIGATIAFLLSRYLFRDWVQEKFSRQLATINHGIEREGNYYLFTLRLVPLLPFFMINLLMGLTPIKAFHYFWVSQVGMFLGTIVYVNAGTQLASLESISGILSPTLIISFSLIGFLPLIAKKIVSFFDARKVYKKYKGLKPKSFERNLVVIGAGSAGLVSSYIASAVKAKVTLVEQAKMGGDCLNTGCVPSKSLIRISNLIYEMNQAEKLGLKNNASDYDFSDVMSRVQQVIKKIEPHDSVERYSQLGVECISGEAKIITPWEVEVNGRRINAKNIIIASGAEPFMPPIPGLEQVAAVNSETVWALKALPKRLVVMGGGPIGCELSQCFARLGSEVSLVEMTPRVFIKEDVDVSAYVEQQFQKESIRVLTDHEVKSVARHGMEIKLLCEHKGSTVEILCDQILVAVGRKARVSNMGLEELGIELNTNGTLAVNEYMQTRFPNILACGDVAGPYQFTHVAAHQAWYAAVNSLFDIVKKFKVDYSVIPWCTFTDPEVARVGLNEQEAKAQGIAYEVTRFAIDDLDRAIVDGEDRGFIKVLTVPGKDKILGVTIVGHNAGEIIAEYVLAMKHRIGLNKILGTIHVYPTMAEANKYLAGEWKKNHTSAKLLNWLERFHHWRLG